MVNFIFRDTSVEQAEKLTGLKYLNFPDDWFSTLSAKYDLNKDGAFVKYLREVDECDIPMPNVVRDLVTGTTHSFDKVSTGVKTLWLINHFPGKFLYPSCFLGQNCYQQLFDVGKDKDIFIYDDSDMLVNEEADMCTGKFKDYLRGNIIELGNERGYIYFDELGI